MPTITITTPAPDSPLQATIIGSYDPVAPFAPEKADEKTLTTTPTIICSIHKDSNGDAVQTINASVNTGAKSFTATVNLGGITPGVYFVTAVYSLHGQFASDGVVNVFKAS